MVSFGWHYDFSARWLQKADNIPDYLLPLRGVTTSFGGMEPEALQYVLATEYGPVAGIGWHRDKAVGVALLSRCVLGAEIIMEEFMERVTLFTGAKRGIGLEVARQLSRRARFAEG